MHFHLPDERLKLCRLVEAVVEDHFAFTKVGLYFGVNCVEPIGYPLECVKVHGVMHFLKLGSPFAAFAQDEVREWFTRGEEELGESLSKRLRLREPIKLAFVGIATDIENAVFDDKWGTLRTTVPNEIDETDALGRTALWRAAHRGYDKQVVELLAAGASPNCVGPNGRTLLEQARTGELEIEIALTLLNHQSVQ